MERREAVRPLFLSLFGVTVLMTVIFGLRTVSLGLMTGGACPIDEEVGESHRVLWDRRRSSQHYFVLIVEHPDGLASLLGRVLNTSHKARVGDCFARVRVSINMCKGGLVEF